METGHAAVEDMASGPLTMGDWQGQAESWNQASTVGVPERERGREGNREGEGNSQR